MTKNVLGVKIDDIPQDEALDKVSSWLLEPRTQNLEPKLIFTPGPEFLLTAQKDEEFRKILNGADLSLPDGFGLQLYAGVKNRVPGREFMLALCREAEKNGWSIGFIGGWEGDGGKIKDNLEKIFPKIKISLVIDGEKATAVKNGSDIDNYIKKDIDILFVGFGHPYQERLLWKLKISNFKFKIGMGVGGALDYLAGRVPEPPKFVHVIGFEWLWRLVTQPRRFKRILRATFLFPIMVFLNRGKVCS